MNATKKIRMDQMILNVVSYSWITLVALLCVLPFLLVLSGSFTKESEIILEGFKLIPKELSLEAYQFIFEYPQDILRAYGVTVSLTVIGTMLSLFFISMSSYVIQRTDFKWRNTFSFIFYFTTLFSGGLVPLYILVVNYLKLKDTYWVLLLLPMINVFYILVMKSFMRSIPAAITESAKIDGAGDFTIFIRLILPLCKPALATIGLFVALNYWNDWFYSLLFISDQKLYPLQYYLYKVIGNVDALKIVAEKTGNKVPDLPGEGIKMALTMVVTGPIIFLYPFIQRYFVKGLTIGAVKG
ncbi:putative aldouronate transport system permease protein [Paenibacillus sp. UNCCL117]|uniref:carbohydrate ABC transporter permease n=1 Tax=unclassified Paenibacillus TaxID=185978 RepID=UPI000882F71A|nr:MULTISPECIES: carbohydrate ABC transporter permease [unclassified Paenibacillus]SDD04912.1 putative aldouronate transport system permease protein [Paenibacillus sp. cl123]SFW31978.1 putative aldouronate transport system permease protein [Paenibacillus sp. UNCCL117]